MHVHTLSSASADLAMLCVPAGSPSRGGELSHSVYSVLVSVSVFVDLSTIFGGWKAEVGNCSASNADSAFMIF